MKLKGINEQVMKSVQGLQEEMIEVTRKLISFPSTLGNEGGAQRYYADLLREIGMKVDIWEPDIDALKKHPAFITSRDHFSNSPVVAAECPGVGEGRSLLLCGHMDVVPPGEKTWSVDPWQGTLKDGKIFGRGACDMKGGLAANYIAIKALQKKNIQLQGDVLAASTIDEESGSTGALALLERGYRADAGVIPEPTGLELNTASTGSIWFRIRVFGESAHAGMAYKGVNSIYKSIKIMEALRELEESRRIRLMHPLYTQHPVPFCLNVNKIEGGEWPATVPAETVLEGRMGISPEETIEEGRQELEERIALSAKGDPWMSDHPPVIQYRNCRWNSGLVEETHPFTKTLQQQADSVLDRHARISGMGPCSDSGTLIRYGGIPTINFGPNSMEIAHQTDEYVDIESLVKTAQVIALTLIHWCGVKEH